MKVSTLLFAGLLTTRMLSAVPLNVFDGVFNNADWSISVLTNTNNAPGNTFDAHQELTGGNPDEYRYLKHNTTRDGSGLYNSIRFGNVYQPLTLAAGIIINSIDASFDLKYFPNDLNSFNSMGYGLAIYQGGQAFGTLFDGSVASDTPNWSLKTLSSLVNTDFCLTDNSNTQNCSVNPIFNGSGGAIQIGYYTVNGLPHSAIYGDQKSGLDNFNVTLDVETPEPATLLPVGLGVIVLALKASRTRQRSRG